MLIKKFKPKARSCLILLGTFLYLFAAQVPALAAEETVTGRFVVKFVDYDPRLKQQGTVQYRLEDESGGFVELVLDDPRLLAEYKGIRPLLGETVTVRGEREGNRLVVAELETGLDPAEKNPQPISGSMPQVTLLLRYADDPSTPQPKSYFEFMYTSSTFPGTNHYIKESSYNIANLDGSQVFGWYDLPGSYNYYNWDRNGNGHPEFDLNRALPDAIALADPDVTFPNYVTINFVMNGHIECDNGGTSCAWSKTSVFTAADAPGPIPYGFTIMGLWGHDRMAVVPHETEHTWGLMHSGSYDGFPYDSHWDVMSGQGVGPWHPTYGHLTVYGISWHMLGMGWIPPARNWESGLSRAGIIQIERLEFPPLVQNTYAMGSLRILGLTNPSYTVEYRNLVGWDAEGPIPGQAVLLHRVNTGYSDQQARVVDIDNDGDPNDMAARWWPTETYQNYGDQVVMHVESWTSSTATVSLSNRGLTEVFVNLRGPEPGFGTEAYPWNTIEEGYSSVYRSGTVHIAPGVYNEGLRIGKPCRLVRNGSSGTVRIGN
jgi:M6 family metalloprotease-like protein